MLSADLSFRDSSSKCCEIELFDSLALSLFFFVFSSAARGVTGIKKTFTVRPFRIYYSTTQKDSKF